MTPKRAAMLRMFAIRVPNRDHGREIGPVEFADAMTSMADARTALSIAAGAPLDQIDRLGYRRDAS